LKRQKIEYLILISITKNNKPSPPLTEETKKNMSLAKIGKKRDKPFTEEHKAKLRAAKALYHPLKGKHHSPETIEKLKDSHRRKGHNMTE
jgi:basic membrane lipoprotein Med (substrate-binding protein (PBP1-ABC) superfamily)